jgi:hypothetical protein
MIPKFTKVQTQDRELNQVQQNLVRSLTPLLSLSLLNGVILSGIVLASGDNTVSHTLGRTLTGWFLVRKRGTAVIYDKQDTNSLPELTLVLNASAGETVDIYVF